jgi:hypothetical protein
MTQAPSNWIVLSTDIDAKSTLVVVMLLILVFPILASTFSVARFAITRWQRVSSIGNWAVENPDVEACFENHWFDQNLLTN